MSNSKISAAKAKEIIHHYRDGLPPGSLRSAWINRDFIDAILSLSSTEVLDGVRIYLGRHTESNPAQGVTAGDMTLILVPTVNGTDLDAYYDYTKICPPHCDGDEGD
jgi:hypothetical protein